METRKEDAVTNVKVHIHQTGIVSGAIVGAAAATLLGLGPLGIAVCAVTGVVFRSWL